MTTSTILALDTATRVVSIALHDGDALIAERTWRSVDHHTAELAPAVADLLGMAGVAARDLAAIAVASGPGSYTGLRIGMAFAKGLAAAADPPTPLIGVPTLDIVAAAQPVIGDRLLAIAQAGRGRVNAAFYASHAGEWAVEVPPAIARWDALAETLAAGGPILVAGEIDPTGRDILLTLGDAVIIAAPPRNIRRAGWLAEIAQRRYAAGQVDDPTTLAPTYAQ